MKNIIGIDPGSTKSAYIYWDGKQILEKGILPNEQIIDMLDAMWREPAVLAVEDMQSIHQKSGKAIIETLKWAGQFYRAWNGERVFVTRDQVKLALGAKDDSGVMAVLIQRFGPKGIKKAPNPITYDLHDHLWAAFAVAVAHWDHLAFQAREIK